MAEFSYKRWAVERRLPDGEVERLGTVKLTPDGYGFTPAKPGCEPVTEGLATFEASLPSWVCYPDGCETRRL